MHQVPLAYMVFFPQASFEPGPSGQELRTLPTGQLRPAQGLGLIHTDLERWCHYFNPHQGVSKIIVKKLQAVKRFLIGSNIKLCTLKNHLTTFEGKKKKSVFPNAKSVVCVTKVQLSPKFQFFYHQLMPI